MTSIVAGSPLITTVPGLIASAQEVPDRVELTLVEFDGDRWMISGAYRQREFQTAYVDYPKLTELAFEFILVDDYGPLHNGGNLMTRLKIALVLVAVLVSPSTFGVVGAEPTKANTLGPKTRLGTFDSRAVAVAYGRSKVFHAELAKLTSRHDQAVAAGNKNLAVELKTEGASLQKVLHKQSFSTWPIENILETIKKEIPEVAKQANVDAIVSKWAIVYQRPGVEFVDVTDLLVQAFAPNEETRNVIKELQRQKPVPLEQFKN